MAAVKTASNFELLKIKDGGRPPCWEIENGHEKCFTFIRRLGIPKRIKISQFRYKMFNIDDLATSCKNLVNLGPVTPGFKSSKDVQPLVDQPFGYVRLTSPLLYLAAMSTEFCGAISTQFCNSYSLGGVTAMPRVLHAGLCRAYPVYN